MHMKSIIKLLSTSKLLYKHFEFSRNKQNCRCPKQIIYSLGYENTVKPENVSNKILTKYNLLVGSKTCRDHPSMSSTRKKVKPIQSSIHSESKTAIWRDEITLGYIYSEIKIKSDIE